eukprot:4145054-Amphidinium_carterae.7
MYELMGLLNEIGMTNHLPYALVRIHHLQKTSKALDVKDVAPLTMASPELVHIMSAAHKEPAVREEVSISNFHVPWERQELFEDMSVEDMSPGHVVLDGPGNTQINANIAQDVEKAVGMQSCPTHGMDHGIADPECVACKQALGPLKKHQPARRMLPVITFDYSGPHVSAVTGDKYALIVVWAYDKTRLVWAFPVESPDGPTTVSCLQVVMEELRTITGGSRPPVLRAHSDRATAFLGKDVKNFLQAHDIRQTTNSGHDPKANGLAKRWVGLIKARTTATLMQSWDQTSGHTRVAMWP